MSFRMAANLVRAQPMGAVRALSTSAVRNDFARMTILGRLTRDPEVKATKDGKEYYRYTVATNDPSGPPDANGKFADTPSSYHNIFAFGDYAMAQIKRRKKGEMVFVDAEFKVQVTPATEEGGYPQTNYLVQQKNVQYVTGSKGSKADYSGESQD